MNKILDYSNLAWEVTSNPNLAKCFLICDEHVAFEKESKRYMDQGMTQEQSHIEVFETFPWLGFKLVLRSKGLESLSASPEFNHFELTFELTTKNKIIRFTGFYKASLNQENIPLMIAYSPEADLSIDEQKQLWDSIVKNKMSGRDQDKIAKILSKVKPFGVFYKSQNGMPQDFENVRIVNANDEDKNLISELRKAGLKDYKFYHFISMVQFARDGGFIKMGIGKKKRSGRREEIKESDPKVQAVIKQLSKGELSYSEIGDRIGMSKTQVKYIYNKFLKNKNDKG